MSLPAEVRVNIYKYALHFEETVTIRELTWRVAYEPALLQVSSQVRREAAPIHYGENSFMMDLSISPDELAWTIQKLRAIVNVCGPRPFGDFRFRPRGPISENFVGLLPLLGESAAFGRIRGQDTRSRAWSQR